MIFQDPLSSLHPLYRMGWQIVEAIRAHTDISRRRRRASGRVGVLRAVGIPRVPSSASTRTRTSSPAGCASAR